MKRNNVNNTYIFEYVTRVIFINYFDFNSWTKMSFYRNKLKLATQYYCSSYILTIIYLYYSNKSKTKKKCFEPYTHKYISSIL